MKVVPFLQNKLGSLEEQHFETVSAFVGANYRVSKSFGVSKSSYLNQVSEHLGHNPYYLYSSFPNFQALIMIIITTNCKEIQYYCHIT